VDYRRNLQPGGTFFFTAVAYRRQPLFGEPAAFALLQDVLREVKAQRPFRMEAWVVLPDHLHMMWTLPPGDANFSQRWSKIKGLFTHRWLVAGGREAGVTRGKRRDARRGIWQPKFIEHTIRNEDDWIAHVEYIHYNPVKHGYVAHPKAWFRSSFAEYARRGLYPANWCCGPGADGSGPAASLSYDGLE
jgi:putative transposase